MRPMIGRTTPQQTTRLCDKRCDIRARPKRDYEYTDCDGCRRNSASRALAPEQAEGDSGTGQRKGHPEKQERHRRDCEEAARKRLRCYAIRIIPRGSPDHDAEEKRGQQERDGHADQEGDGIGESRVIAWFVLRIRRSIAIAPTVRAETATPMRLSLDIRRTRLVF